MVKLRAKFWTEARKLVEWCSDEELRVLRQMAATRIEARLKEETDKLDLDILHRKEKSKKIAKQRGKKR